MHFLHVESSTATYGVHKLNVVGHFAVLIDSAVGRLRMLAVIYSVVVIVTSSRSCCTHPIASAIAWALYSVSELCVGKVEQMEGGKCSIQQTIRISGEQHLQEQQQRARG